MLCIPLAIWARVAIKYYVICQAAVSTATVCLDHNTLGLLSAMLYIYVLIKNCIKLL